MDFWIERVVFLCFISVDSGYFFWFWIGFVVLVVCGKVGGGIFCFWEVENRFLGVICVFVIRWSFNRKF